MQWMMGRSDDCKCLLKYSNIFKYIYDYVYKYYMIQIMYDMTMRIKDQKVRILYL